MENYGFLSVLPVIIAIILAVACKNVVVSLFLSVLAGVIILLGNVTNAVPTLIQDYLVVQVTDDYNAGVLVLLVFIGGFIALMEKSGGAVAFAKKTSNLIDTKFKVQTAAWIGGIIIFFSDLGTPLIVGPVFEPMFDKLKVSREKLAWILDSTASPIAVLVPFIGWGVYIMGLIQKEYELLGIPEAEVLGTFMSTIPFNIYSILSVVMVPIIAFSGYNFSSMAKAEERTNDGKLFWDTSQPMRTPEVVEYENSKPYFIWIPLLVLLVTLFSILAPLGFPFKKVPGGAFRAALSTGYLFGAITLIGLMVFNKVKTFSESFSIYMSGVNKMMYVAVILVLSWSLGSISKELGTSEYIIEVLGDTMPYWILPAIAFVVGAVLSFATGTSWGAYAIMLPLVIPMAVAINSPLFPCIGAVLSGGMFGDHCSPISDTTILSSTGAGCDLIDHVKTQLPYALLNALSAVIGYIVAGFTGSPIALLVSLCFSVISFIAISKYSGNRIKNEKITNV